MTPERPAVESTPPLASAEAEVSDAVVETPEDMPAVQNKATLPVNQPAQAAIEGKKGDHGSMRQKPHYGLNPAERKSIGRINRFVFAPILGAGAFGLGEAAKAAIENGHQLPLALGEIVVGATFAASAAVAAFGSNSTRRYDGQRRVVEPKPRSKRPVEKKEKQD